MRLARDAAASGETLGIALIGNAAELLPALREHRARARRWSPTRPRRTTRSTATSRPATASPRRSSCAPAIRSATSDASIASMARHVGAMLAFQDDGAIVFEYGNNIRGHAEEAGEARAFEIEGFVPLFIRPSFCRRPRSVPLGLPVRRSGGPEASPTRRRSPNSPTTSCCRPGWRWRRSACRSRACRRAPAGSALGERDRMGLVFNRLVREGKLKGPVAMSRDHLDTGSVAQPTRETERHEGRQRRRSPTGRCSTRCSTPSTAPTSSRSTRAAAAAWAARSRPA